MEPTFPPTDRRALRVLALSPFHGGSHRQFLDQWAARSRHRFTILGMPASHWKWRMRHAAPDLARRVQPLAERGEGWDLVFCTDMLDLAAFRGLSPPAVRDLPAVLYFHENQLTYPVRDRDERDLHFALTNVVSALAADQCWFNSGFHRDSFLEAIPELLRGMPDRGLRFAPETIERRSRVEWPGVERPRTAGGGRRAGSGRADQPLHFVWAARWEHDKGPDLLLEALERLDSRLPLRFSIAGQRFAESPAAFEQIRALLGERLGHFGPLPRDRYLELLLEADVFVSTAHHEFFGLAAVEAALAGARPLLPDRLAYPELLAEAGVDPDARLSYLWPGGAGELAERIRSLALGGLASAPSPLVDGFGVFEWSRRRCALDDRIQEAAEQRSP